MQGDSLEREKKILSRVSLVIGSDEADAEDIQYLRKQFIKEISVREAEEMEDALLVRLERDGLSLHADGQVLKGDFTRMLPRLKNHNLSGELLVRAARIKNADHVLTAIDATAGLGEDSLLLAAAGFQVRLYERNPVIYELLRDALKRAVEDEQLGKIVSKMQLVHGDSIEAMQHLEEAVDVILLDPMFPERQKSALVKKKLQVIQQLEVPCADEKELMRSAVCAAPKKLIIKRPPKGPYLAGIKPDYSIEGKAVRFDVFVSPYDRIEKFKAEGLNG